MSSNSFQSTNRKTTSIFQNLIVSIIFLFILLSFNNVFAAQLKLTFDRSSDSRAIGYKIFYGKSKSFSNIVDVGNGSSFLTPALEKGAVYYFAAKAYDKYGNQSSFSETLSFKVPDTTTAPSNTGTISPSTGNTGTPAQTNDFIELNEDFQNYPVGSSPSVWMNTKAGNSMNEDKQLFKVFNFDKQNVFGTTSTSSNIHSHHVKSYIDKLSSFEYSGRMMMTSSNSGIGVTFLSHYPFADNYYRLRQYEGSSSFHLSPHGTAKVSGITDSGVIPQPNQWYNFRILVENTGTRTEILAKVWPENNSEPRQWQIEAYDNTSKRLVSGTVGIWSGGAGSKYWDDLQLLQ
jgi:hypothetical protein